MAGQNKLDTAAVEDNILEDVSGGFYSEIPRRASADIICPYCGEMNHARFEAKGHAFSPYQDHENCGVCAGYLKGKCNASVIFDFKTKAFYFKKRN